jgi:cyclic beta-1,2-glucan synthetase
VLWFIRALAELGRGDEALEMLEMITPVHHTRTPKHVACYGAEPYVVAADIYGEPPHLGRAGWTWYTGSAGWMVRVALESILGLHSVEGQWLRIRPCLPKSWPGYALTYRLPHDRTQYDLRVYQSGSPPTRVITATLDGQPVEIHDRAALVPILHDGLLHRVEIHLS